MIFPKSSGQKGGKPENASPAHREACSGGVGFVADMSTCPLITFSFFKQSFIPDLRQEEDQLLRKEVQRSLVPLEYVETPSSHKISPHLEMNLVPCHALECM